MQGVRRLSRALARRTEPTDSTLSELARSALLDAPLTVIDVGALGGLLPELAPIERYVAAVGFDPDPAECERLNAHAQARGMEHRYLPYAVAGDDGTRTFHVLRKEASSSLLEPNREYHDRFPDAERMDVMETLDVETRALGPLLASQGVEAEFLKLDAHGVENEILASLADEQLARLLGAHVELLLAEHYVGQTSLGAVHDRLLTAGLELYSLKRYSSRRAGFDSFRYRTRGQLSFCDALYLRRADGLSAEQRRRLMVVAAAFRHYDFAHELAAGDEPARETLLRLASAGRGRGPWESDGSGDWI